MVLVDTSVLIGYFGRQKGIPFDEVDTLINNGIPFGITKNIYQELLQGVQTEQEFKQLKEYLNTLSFYELKYGRGSYEKAALLYFKCRKAGITIRSTVDVLIAETAIENDVCILHNDTDFVNMAKVIKELRLYAI
jgi:predicted nucleic acid-binding protein